MKALLRHGAQCKQRATNGCPTCKRIWALLQIHARQCRLTDGCHVPRCSDLKAHLRRMRMQQRHVNDRRRQQFETGHRQHNADLAARGSVQRQTSGASSSGGGARRGGGKGSK